MKKDKLLFIAGLISAVALLIGIVAVIVLMGLAKKVTTYFAFLNIMSGTYALLSIATVYALRKQMDIVGMAIILGNCVLSFGQLYFLDNRLYHRLLFILLIISLLHLIVGFVSFWLHRRKERWYSARHLLSFVLGPCFVGFTFIIKASWQMKLIETDVEQIGETFAFAGLVVGLAALILSVILIKECRNKKEYFGKLAASFFVPMLLVFALPMLLAEHINYAFDATQGIQKECVVLQKETRRSSSSKSGPRYYLHVRVDSHIIEFNINRAIYAQYDVGDTMKLHAHTGALGFSYYEYAFEEIYRYNVE